MAYCLGMHSPDDLRMTFGLALARHRRTQGLSQERLAELAGVHRTYVSQVERGQKSPTLSVLFRLSSAVGISASKLVAEVEVGCA